MPKQPTPEVGDFWEDTDPRMPGRRVKVVEVESGLYARAVCETKAGRKVRLSVARMEKGQGWRLIERWSKPSAEVEV